MVMSDIRWVSDAIPIAPAHEWLTEVKIPFTVGIVSRFLKGIPFLFGYA